MSNRRQQSFTSRPRVFTPSSGRTYNFPRTPRFTDSPRDRGGSRGPLHNVVPEDQVPPIEREEEHASGSIYPRPPPQFETPRAPPSSQQARSLYNCIANGVFNLKEAAEIIFRQKQRDEFNKTAYEEFVNSETTFRVIRYCCAGLTGLSGNALEIRMIASQIQGDMLAAKIDNLTRQLEVCGRYEEPQKLLEISLRNCTKEWNLDAPSPFAKVSLNDLVLGYDFKGREGQTVTQKFICLYRFLLQQITDPPYRIQEFSVRKNQKGGKNKALKNFPRPVETFLMDFVTDLIGYGGEDARTGQRLAEKLFYRTELFKALQIALRDVRNSQYDFEEERFIPSNRKGKRARVSDTSQGEGDENVSPRQQRQS